MGPETADILRFLAFGLVWLFPVALVIAVLGFSSADAKADARARREDAGPNVVPFPVRKPAEPPTPINWLERVKRLAFPRFNR